MFGRILSVALLLSTFTGSSQAFALSDCPVDVECGTSPITTFAALPLSGAQRLGWDLCGARAGKIRYRGRARLSKPDGCQPAHLHYRWSDRTGGSDGGFRFRG